MARDDREEKVTAVRGGGVWRRVGLIFVVGYFLLGGAGHFVLTDAFVSVVPSYVPHARFVVLATGACEIAGACALFFTRWRSLAGYALMAFTLCVTPVHVDMLLNADRYEYLGEPLLWARLALQPVLIWIIWSVTKRDTRVRPS